MLTSVTMPSIGAVRVASLIWAFRSSRVLRASDSCVSALLTAILAWRIWSVTSASSASERLALAMRSWILAVSTARVRGGELALEIGRVGRGEDVALLDGVADGDLDIGHGPGGRAGGRVGAGEVGRRPEGQAVGGARGDGPGRGDVVGDVAFRHGPGQVLGRVRRARGQSADRHERGPDADGRQHDDGEDLQLHARLP